MAAVRTQVYLSASQRAGIDRLIEREHKTLAQIVREAVDAYLASHARSDAEASLTATFGALPDLVVPARDEWQRGPDSD